MSAEVQRSFVAQMLRLLPGPLLRAADGWSERIARRKREERLRKWQARKLAAAGSTQR
jgi:hypothetical protein